jgi:hypothetical protein
MQQFKDNETPTAATVEASANNYHHTGNQTSQYIMGYRNRLVDANKANIFAEPLLFDRALSIPDQIIQIDRGNTSSINVKTARELLKFTGSATKYCALFLKNGKELQTAWFKTRERAKQAVDILVGKGFQSIVLVD